MQNAFFPELANSRIASLCSAVLPLALSAFGGLGRTAVDEVASNEEEAANAEAYCDIWLSARGIALMSS
eukprot:4610597-Prorocentrum_lima.AAC.1